MSNKSSTKQKEDSSRTNLNQSNKKNSKKKKSFYKDKDSSSKKTIVQNKSKKKNSPLKTTPENKIVYEDEYQGLIYHPSRSLINNINKAKYEYYNFQSKWKTEMCHFWQMNGKCKFGDNCAFAHGDSELKEKQNIYNYKTKPCKQFFELGYCTYGSRCQFSHKKKEDKTKENFSYLKIMKEFLSDDNHISHDLVKRPRLKTFEDLTKCTIEESENSKLKLYEDIIILKNGEKKIEKNKFIKFSEDTNSNSNKLYDNIGD